MGINDLGEIVGASNHIFVYRDGVYTTLPDPPSTTPKNYLAPTGINNLGEVVGSYSSAFAVYHGFL